MSSWSKRLSLPKTAGLIISINENWTAFQCVLLSSGKTCTPKDTARPVELALFPFTPYRIALLFDNRSFGWLLPFCPLERIKPMSLRARSLGDSYTQTYELSDLYQTSLECQFQLPGLKNVEKENYISRLIWGIFLATDVLKWNWNWIASKNGKSEKTRGNDWNQLRKESRSLLLN